MAGLYLHIPFCKSKCSYCDFYSVEARGFDLQAYPELLIRDLTQDGDHQCPVERCRGQMSAAQRSTKEVDVGQAGLGGHNTGTHNQ